MSSHKINKSENNRTLIREMQRWYWEATGQHWYPEKRAIQFVLCKLRQQYDISKREQITEED